MSDLIKLLAQSSLKIDSEGATTEEICNATGMGRNWVTEQLRQIHKEGRLTVCRKPATDIAGRKVNVPAYRIAPSKSRLNGADERPNSRRRRIRPAA